MFVRRRPDDLPPIFPRRSQLRTAIVNRDQKYFLSFGIDRAGRELHAENTGEHSGTSIHGMVGFATFALAVHMNRSKSSKVPLPYRKHQSAMSCLPCNSAQTRISRRASALREQPCVHGTPPIQRKNDIGELPSLMYLVQESPSITFWQVSRLLARPPNLNKVEGTLKVF